MEASETTDQRAEIQRLLDRQAIVDCLHRYTRGLDRHDDELYKSPFFDDAIVHFGDFFGSPREFIEWAGELHASEPWTAHTHFIDCNHIDIDGAVAHAESYVFFVHRREDGETKIQFGGGRYVDRLEKRHGEWRIAARQLVMEWTAEAQGVMFADTATYPRGTWDRTDPSYSRPLQLG